ncbi:MAG: hypothetical protein ACOVNV_10865, partial [Pirellulaceae bacterium]
MPAIHKALITAAGPRQNTLPLQRLVDRDGVEKSALQMIIEEVLAAGIESVHVPIVDMQPPTVVEALDLCESIDRWMAESKPVCVHCRAGL